MKKRTAKKKQELNNYWGSIINEYRFLYIINQDAIFSAINNQELCFLLIHLDADLGKSHEVRGTFKITSGVTYNPNLQDRLSVDFKVLAFDLQQMVGGCLSTAGLKSHNQFY